MQQHAYLNTRVRYVGEGLGGVRRRLDVDDPEFEFPILADLRAPGGTDYVAMPLPFSDGQVQTLLLGRDRLRDVREDMELFTVEGQRSRRRVQG